MLKKSLGAVLFFVSSFLAAAPTTVKVALDWYINPDHAPLLVAQTYGYFAKEGLNVEFIQPTTTADARNLVLTHQADIGIDYQPEMLLAINQGMPLKVFGNLVPTPLTCIASLASGPVSTMKDLQNQSIAYGGGALEEALLRAELQHAGVDPSTVNLVPVNMDLTQVLLSKKVTAVAGFMRNVEPIELKSQGVQTNVFYPEKNGVPTYAELVFIADPKHTDPEMLKRFLKAVAEGVTTLKAHPLDAWNKVKAAYPQELASSQAIAAQNSLIWLASFAYFTTNMDAISVDNYQAYNVFLLKNNLIKTAVPLTLYWWKL